jgi:hypothetical protein
VKIVVALPTQLAYKLSMTNEANSLLAKATELNGKFCVTDRSAYLSHTEANGRNRSKKIKKTLVQELIDAGAITQFSQYYWHPRQG